MNKFELDTPCLVIDKPALMHNLEHMQNQVNLAGKNLRPHIKTHKCSTLAKLQIKQGAKGVSAAKVSEALVLANSGVKNTLITSPVVTPEKLKNLVLCREQDEQLTVVCDSIENASKLNQIMQTHQLTLNILVDVDAGVERTGVSYDNALPLSEHIHKHCEHLHLLGIQCYAGNLQHVHDFQAREAASASVMKKASLVKQALIKNNLPCDILSGSGTGTYDIDMTLPETTEVQPGSYTVMDMEYHNITSRNNTEAFTTFMPAMTMLVTVISANHATHVTVDAGTKSIYVDAHTKPRVISHPGLHYDWNGFGDEHGKITADTGVTLPKVGDVLELIVPHCDPTINLHSQFAITESNQVQEYWAIDMQGCVK
ncbi:MAG: DSD1 family PLP-dependent enzyme [Gammaproteobacteria bacterium]|nr:DSD1 family PLP-dependent enzyme [Gammaproteobacteria bacterium]